MSLPPAVHELRKLFTDSETVNDPKAWDQAWIQNTTPWDSQAPQNALVELLDGKHDDDVPHIPVAGQSGEVPLSHITNVSGGTVLVPGCGRGYDVQLFASKGLQAVGVDISPAAVAAANKWKDEQSIDTPTRDRMSFVEADFFDIATPSSPHPSLQQRGAVDLAYDYTFLCALPPTLRQKWAETYTRAVRPGGYLIALVFPIHGDRAGGPPFSLSPDLVRQLLGSQKEDDGKGAWKEVADLEPKEVKEERKRGVERIMVWRREGAVGRS